MAKLGAYPTFKNYKSWMTQRFLNAAPFWAKARSFPGSVANQLLNPIGAELQETALQLFRERYNMFLSLADLNQIDTLYRVNLPQGFSFQYEEPIDGLRNYTAPSVFTTINGTEYEISQAENNNIETISVCLPSRIEDSIYFQVYEKVLEETTIANLSSAILNNPSLPSNLYITIKNNSNWQVEIADTIFYCKVYIKGKTRKETIETEVLPIRQNGMYKTKFEWKEINEIFVSYMSEDATIEVDCFPLETEGLIDNRNLHVPNSGIEKQQYLRIDDFTFGTALLAESFAANEADMIRAGMEDKDINYSLELLNTANANVSLNSFVPWPNTDWVFAIDDDNFYVYDTRLSFVDCRELEDSPESKFDLYVDKHFCNRDETITVKTRNLSVSDPPASVRWTLTDPDGYQFYLDLKGVWHDPLSTDGWIDNVQYASVRWREQQIELSFNKTGQYIIMFEAKYEDEETLDTVILNSKTFVYIPTAKPEVEFALPVALQDAKRIVLDSDNNIWILDQGDVLRKVDIFFDYFLVDYESNIIWLRENYDSVRVELDV